MPKWVKALYSPTGIVGWAFIFLIPAYKLVDLASNVQFITDFWPHIQSFLEAPGGFIATFLAGCSIIGYSIHRSSTSEATTDSDLGARLLRAKERTKPELAERAAANRKALFSPEQERPRYQPPPNQTYDSMSKHSNAVLGEFLIVAGQQVERFLSDFRHRTDNVRASRDFINTHGPAFFGLYQEARRRGYKNDLLDNYFEYPDNIQNQDSVKWIANELQKFGAQVKLRAWH